MTYLPFAALEFLIFALTGLPLALAFAALFVVLALTEV